VEQATGSCDCRNARYPIDSHDAVARDGSFERSVAFANFREIYLSLFAIDCIAQNDHRDSWLNMREARSRSTSTPRTVPATEARALQPG